MTVARAGALVLAIALLVALGACGGDDSIETGATGGASGAGGGVPAAPADGPVAPPDAGGGGAPADAFRRYQQVAKKGDVGGLYDGLTTTSRQQFDGMVEQQRTRILTAAEQDPQTIDRELRSELGMGLDEFRSATTRDLAVHFLRLGLKEDAGVLDAEVLGEPVVEGDRATLTYRQKDGTTDTADMVREGGVWKLDLDLSGD